MELSSGANDCVMSETSNEVMLTSETSNGSASQDSKTEPIELSVEESIVDNKGQNKDECGNLLIVSNNAVPQQEGENETTTELEGNLDVSESSANDISEIYKLKNANEKIEKLGQFKQYQSNMIHDLIIGRTKQRKARQPRIVATSRTVPLPPNESSPKSENNLENLEDFKMIDDDDTLTDRNAREKSLSRSLRENSLSRSIRESSTPRSFREGSPKIVLPPTPITNPEKFGISVAKDSRRKDYNKGSINSLISPTDSNASNDIDCHLDGISTTDSSAPVSPNKGSGRDSSLASPSHQNSSKKSKGFMAAVAGIFRTASPSPLTSPVHEKSMKREDSFLGRWSRKDNPKQKDFVNGKDLILRTASLSLQASHPSTPPVPLSRRIKLGSQPGQGRQGRDIMDRLERRKTKAGRKAARQAASNRARKAQEIQRELEEIEVECQALEE